MENNGLIVKISENDFNTTYANLRKLIQNNPNLKIVAELDHQANAKTVGMDLHPAKIIFFGNPKLGTPLMKISATLGIDLPQKFLVFQDKDEVKIAFNNPMYLEKRHAIDGANELLDTIMMALNALATSAAMKT